MNHIWIPAQNILAMIAGKTLPSRYISFPLNQLEKVVEKVPAYLEDIVGNQNICARRWAVLTDVFMEQAPRPLKFHDHFEKTIDILGQFSKAIRDAKSPSIITFERTLVNDLKRHLVYIWKAATSYKDSGLTSDGNIVRMRGLRIKDLDHIQDRKKILDSVARELGYILADVQVSVEEKAKKTRYGAMKQRRPF